MKAIENSFDLPGNPRLEKLSQETEHVETLLKKYFSNLDADRMAKKLFDWAVELDEIVDQIKNDSRIRDQYSYDGKFFDRKDEKLGFHTCYDGLNFLRVLDPNNVSSFFIVEPEKAKRNLMKWLEDNYIKTTRQRLYFLKNYGNISLVTKEQIEEAKLKMEKEEREKNKGHQSSIPDDFFEQYEKEINDG